MIAPPLEGAIASWAESNQAPVLSVSTYLANRLEANGRAVPYSAIAALDTAAAAPFGGFVLRGGGTAPALAENEILVDDWVADDLGIDAGDEVAMTYFEVGPKEELLERRETFRCRGVVKLSNLAADPRLTPDFPGISGAADMREWDPPFPVDLDAIRPRDEAFWDQHRATPKAFFAPATAKLWSTRFGATTSMRIAVPPAQDGDATPPVVAAAAMSEMAIAAGRALPPAIATSPASCARASTPSCRAPPIPRHSASASTRCASAACRRRPAPPTSAGSSSASARF